MSQPSDEVRGTGEARAEGDPLGAPAPSPEEASGSTRRRRTASVEEAVLEAMVFPPGGDAAQVRRAPGR